MCWRGVSPPEPLPLLLLLLSNDYFRIFLRLFCFVFSCFLFCSPQAEVYRRARSGTAGLSQLRVELRAGAHRVVISPVSPVSFVSC